VEEMSPRYHHYMLAHVALRSIAHADPMTFFSVLASAKKDAFLEALLQSVEDNNDSEEHLDFSVADLALHPGRVGEYPVIYLEFPSPQRATEVYFVGAVLKLMDHETVQASEIPEVDFYTLERGVNLGGETQTVLGGWNPQGDHANFGEGPAPEIQAFHQAICARYPVEASSPPQAEGEASASESS